MTLGFADEKSQRKMSPIMLLLHCKYSDEQAIHGKMYGGTSRGWNVQIPMQNYIQYIRLGEMVIISATLVNTNTDTQDTQLLAWLANW